MARLRCLHLSGAAVLLHAFLSGLAYAEEEGHNENAGVVSERFVESKEDFIISLMLLGSVGFIFANFYLVNHKDTDIQRYSWEVISATASIFAAVLTFQAFNSVFEYYLVGDEGTYSERLMVDSFQLLVWLGLLQWTLGNFSGAITFCGKSVLSDTMDIHAASQRAHDLHRTATLKEIEQEAFEVIRLETKCWSTLLGHITGFAAINLAVLVQHIVPTNFAAVLAVPFVAGLCLTLFYHIVWRLRRHLSKADDDEIDEYEKLWNVSTMETEDDILSLMVSFLLVQWVRYLINGVLPNQEGLLPEGFPFELRESIGLFATGLLFSGIQILQAFLSRRPRRQTDEKSETEDERKRQFWSSRTEEWFRDVSTMCFAWCLYFSVFETIRDYFFSQSQEAVVTVVTALVVTVLALCFIFFLDLVADLEATSDEVDASLRAFILALALLIGFSWERSFDAAVVSITEIKYVEKVVPPPVTKLLLAALLALIVIPAWKRYILTRAIEIQKEADASLKITFANMDPTKLHCGKAAFPEIIRERLEDMGVPPEVRKALRITVIDWQTSHDARKTAVVEIRGTIPFHVAHFPMMELKRSLHERHLDAWGGTMSHEESEEEDEEEEWRLGSKPVQRVRKGSKPRSSGDGRHDDKQLSQQVEKRIEVADSEELPNAKVSSIKERIQSHHGKRAMLHRSSQSSVHVLTHSTYARIDNLKDSLNRAHGLVEERKKMYEHIQEKHKAECEAHNELKANYDDLMAEQEDLKRTVSTMSSNGLASQEPSKERPQEKSISDTVLPDAPSPELHLVETLQQELERAAQSEMEHRQRLDEQIGHAKDLEQKLLAAMDVEHRLVQTNKQLEQELLEARAAHEQEVVLKEQSLKLLQEADDNMSALHAQCQVDRHEASSKASQAEELDKEVARLRLKLIELEDAVAEKDKACEAAEQKASELEKKLAEKGSQSVVLPQLGNSQLDTNRNSIGPGQRWLQPRHPPSPSQAARPSITSSWQTSSWTNSEDFRQQHLEFTMSDNASDAATPRNGVASSSSRQINWSRPSTGLRKYSPPSAVVPDSANLAQRQVYTTPALAPQVAQPGHRLQPYAKLLVPFINSRQEAERRNESPGAHSAPPLSVAARAAHERPLQPPHREVPSAMSSMVSPGKTRLPNGAFQEFRQPLLHPTYPAKKMSPMAPASFS